MGLFDDSGILKKILYAFPSKSNPAIIRGMTAKFRDDFNTNLSSSDWEILQSGLPIGSVVVTSGALTIRPGTINNQLITVRSKFKVSIPCKISFICSLGNRYANQDFYLELVDASGQHFARFLLTGTTANSITPQVGNGGVGTSTALIGTSLLSRTLLELDVFPDVATFSFRPLDTGSGRGASTARNSRVPDPNLEYFIQIRAVNGTGVSANNEFFIDAVSYQSLEIISTELLGGRGSALASESIPIIAASNYNLPVTIASGNTNVAVTALDAPIYTGETISPIAANATFTGIARNTSNRKNLCVFVATDQPGTLFIDWSFDSTTWYTFAGIPCTAGNPVINRQETMLQYYRIRYINGSNAATPKIYSLLRFL